MKQRISIVMLACAVLAGGALLSAQAPRQESKKETSMMADMMKDPSMMRQMCQQMAKDPEAMRMMCQEMMKDETAMRTMCEAMMENKEMREMCRTMIQQYDRKGRRQ